MATVAFASKTDTGRKRDHNEDYLWVNHDLGIYIIADGVGGNKHGEVASQMAAEHAGKRVTTFLQDSADYSGETLKTILTGSLEEANQRVYTTAQQEPSSKGMSTTLLIAVIDKRPQPPKAYISHAGDCRAYRFQAPPLQQLTNDDVWPFTGSFAAKFGEHLTQAVGQEHPLEPQVVETELLSGDWLLLCTDGLWKMLDEEELVTCLQQAPTPDACVERLVAAANEAGGQDNISVIAVHFS